MIYIVEIPHQLPPKVWSRPNKEQIMNAIDKASTDIIYDESTGHDLLNVFGYDSTAEMRDDETLATLADQIDAHGLDATFYRCCDDYTTEPVDEWTSYLERNGHDLNIQRVYMSEDEVRDALADDSKWNIHQGIKARIALKKELAKSQG